RVPVDLARGGRVGGEARHDTGRQGVAEAGESFGDLPAGGFRAGRVVEDDADHREADVAGGADDAHGGQALELERQRVGDLVLDLAGTVAGPVGEDDDLVLAQVGNGIDGGVVDGVDAGDGHGQAGEDHQEAVADGEFDDAVDHLLASGRA